MAAWKCAIFVKNLNMYSSPYKYWFLASLAIACISFQACDETPSESQETLSEDTLEVFTQETSRGLENSAMRPELVGTWKLVDMLMGKEPMAQEIPTEYLEFIANGTVANYVDDFPPDTSRLTQEGDMLRAALWEKEQRIDSLTGKRLVLVETVDGVEIAYIYERQK